VSRPAALARAGLVLAVVLALDQLVKRIVVDTVDPGTSNAVFPGLEIVHVRNHGVAFGALADGQTVVAIVIGIALTALVVYFVMNARRPLLWLPTGMLLGGALGNVVDRLRDGAVTDFIKLPAWPAFNLADMSITFGVLVLLYVLERGNGADRPA
jgi:signal peptidase II